MYFLIRWLIKRLRRRFELRPPTPAGVSPIPAGAPPKPAAPPEPAALAVSGLGKRFGDRVAFADLSFEIGHGEVLGLSPRPR